ncbi:MAG: hypothetical protein MK171_11255 [Pirellulales bacterium]|nr:hypothetical protein [Pirellulales bacterium]
MPGMMAARRGPRPALLSACSAPLVALLLSGCAGEDLVGPTVPVEGQITWKGNEVTTGTVIFLPDASKGNAAEYDSRGAIDASGHYSLKTLDKEGAPPGHYMVGVVSSKRPPGVTDPNYRGFPPPNIPLIPLKYQNPASSGLTVEARENAPPGEYDFKLEGEIGRTPRVRPTSKQ